MSSDADEEFSLRTFTKRKNISSVSSVLKNVINKCEKTKPKQINIMDLAAQHQGNHRRLYELFNLLTYFGVTQSSGRGKLSWVGFNSMYENIEQNYLNLEERSKNNNLQVTFQLSPNPSLGQIANNFIALFPFLNVTYINIKNATNLLSYGITDRKALERRMYLALSLLETVGCIEHKPRSGQYKILLDIKEMSDKVNKSAPSSPQDILSIDFLLNHSNSTSSDKFLQRQKEFEELTS